MRYFSDSPTENGEAESFPLVQDGSSISDKRSGDRFPTLKGTVQMATKTQTIEVKVDERLAGEIAGKAVHGWHATAYSDGKRRVYVTFEEVKTVGA